MAKQRTNGQSQKNDQNRERIEKQKTTENSQPKERNKTENEWRDLRELEALREEGNLTEYSQSKERKRQNNRIFTTKRGKCRKQEKIHNQKKRNRKTNGAICETLKRSVKKLRASQV